MNLDMSPAGINARAAARGDLARWLMRRYGAIELVEIADEPDPINLRQIFIPLRLSPQPISESDSDEATVGDDAWDIVARERFLAISGLPGSGKSTLTKALISEIHGSHESRLRNALRGRHGIAAVPFILRELGDLSSVRSIEDLFERWWSILERQLTSSKAPNDRKLQTPITLDIPRLRESFSPGGENFSALYLFDGIDEVGGLEIRNNILRIASEVVKLGHRVVLTGRPGGFEGLSLPIVSATLSAEVKADTRAESALLGGVLGAAIGGKSGALLGAGLGLLAGEPKTEISEQSVAAKLFYIAPLVEAQIEDFIGRWYSLRPEWQGKRDSGIKSFLDGVRDKRRSYLRELARRPIFLTLMALVHCTRNDMPHGRVELYKAIIDNYLVRQDRHRQIRENINGHPMPHWPDIEKRLALGYLAWESQKRRSQERTGKENAVVWPKEDLIQQVAKLLTTTKYGRFSVLHPEDAEALVDYLLHPASLLVEPVVGQIQFAHLSFQEYLCADYLQGRMSVRSNETFRNEIACRLTEPGWNEVALQAFAIHAEKTHNEGHLDLISQINIENVEEAQLLLDVVTGKEVPFSRTDRESYAPIIALSMLLHPRSLVQPRTEILKEAAHAFIIKALSVSRPQDIRPLFKRDPDQAPSPDWEAPFKKWAKGRKGWGLLADLCSLIPRFSLMDDASLASAAMEKARNIDASFKKARHVIIDKQGRFTDCAAYFDKISNGEITSATLRLADYFPGICVHPSVFKSHLPEIAFSKILETPSCKGRIVATLCTIYELMMAARGPGFSAIDMLINWYYEPGISFRGILGINDTNAPKWRRCNGLSCANIIGGNYTCISNRPQSIPNHIPVIIILCGAMLSAEFSSKEIAEILEGEEIYARTSYFKIAAKMAPLLGAKEFFREYVAGPSGKFRELFPGELPIPENFEVFDSTGMPSEEQHRNAWVSLRDWIHDADKVIDFVGGNTLSTEERHDLKTQYNELAQTFASPLQLIDAMLNDWPEGETRAVHLNAVEDEFLEELRKLRTLDVNSEDIQFEVAFPSKEATAASPLLSGSS